MSLHSPHLVNASSYSAQETPQRRRLHLCAGLTIVIALYTLLVAFVRVALMKG
jgi:hypothetical protein